MTQADRDRLVTLQKTRKGLITQGEAASNGDAHRALDKSQHLAARILLIVRMSSDRLFLDRVGRHQSPSPLHRHEQSNTHISKPRPKGDISTLR